MILGIGIDAIETARFASWHTYPRVRLKRILADEEIDYCLSSTPKSAQRFAARFAAREAFFKALNTVIPDHTISLLQVCRYIKVTRISRGATTLTVNWEKLLAQEKLPTLPAITSLISITHTKSTTTVIVLLQQKSSKNFI